MIITTNFPRWTGDFRAPFIFEAAKALIMNGHQVCVLTMHNPGALDHEVMEGVEVYRVRYAAKEENEILQRDTAGIPAAWKKSFSAKLLLFRFYINLIVAIGKHAHNMDVIHANWTLSGMAAYLSKVKHRLPYVVTIHGSDIYGIKNNFLLKLFTKIALANAKKVIAVSQDLKKAAITLGVKEQNITVIPTGVNLDIFPYNTSCERLEQILFVGSLIKRKGVNYLIQAFAKISKSFPSYRLVIIGEGEEKEDLFNLSQKLNIAEKVVFCGTKTQNEIASTMRESKIFVLPSTEEGQGAVLIEAMASGTPCVGSRAGGIAGVIDSATGLLFEPGNADELAENLSKLIKDKGLWKTFSANGRVKAENHYSWRELAKIMEKNY
ncbi:MAG: glycosyltransferase family 4 protein [Anaerolineaceae bacterium]|nr:glycosyltransferase family 4 protein [Anaerolineaceae bacterium]